MNAVAGAALVFGVETRVARARRRLMLLNIVVPLALVAPVALAGAPPHHAAAVYTVLFVLFGTFGSAIPLLRDAQSGLIGRLAGSALQPAAILLGRSAAGALLDLLQLLPAVLLAFAAAGAPPAAIAAFLPVLTGTLAVASLLGIWVAAAARSLAEGALFSAVAALLLLHASGVFRTPAPGSATAAIAAAAPFQPLDAWVRALAAGTAPDAGHAAGLAITLAAAALVTTLASRVLVRAVCSAAHGS
jgi:hypothetical protein